MIYQWKVPGLYPVDAQTAGEELSRIYSEHGALEPRAVVDESRSEAAPLHSCFEWRDDVAAEKFRENQAAGIIRAITVKAKRADSLPTDVRCFVHVQHGYHPVSVVLSSEDMRADMIDAARRDMDAFVRKYRDLDMLSDVIDAMTALLRVS